MRQSSTIFSRRSVWRPPPLAGAADGGLAPFFLGITDRFNGAASLSFPLPLAVPLTEERWMNWWFRVWSVGISGLNLDLIMMIGDGEMLGSE